MADILDVRTLHAGWARYRLARVRLGDGQVIEREVEDHGRAVAVLPFCPERRVATLVAQLRVPVLLDGGPAELLEVPAGLSESDNPEDDARREVEEETGLRVRSLEPVATVWAMPGISTERMSLFLAAYRPEDRVGSGGGLAAEHEHIRVVERDLAELWRMADSGEVADMKTLLLLSTLRLRRPDLFEG